MAIERKTLSTFVYEIRQKKDGVKRKFPFAVFMVV